MKRSFAVLLSTISFSSFALEYDDFELREFCSDRPGNTTHEVNIQCQLQSHYWVENKRKVVLGEGELVVHSSAVDETKKAKVPWRRKVYGARPMIGTCSQWIETERTINFDLKLSCNELNTYEMDTDVYDICVKYARKLDKSELKIKTVDTGKVRNFCPQ